MIAWLLGTFLITAVCVVDTYFDLELPGSMLYVIIIASIAIAATSSLLAPVQYAWRAVVFCAAVAVMFIEIVVLAVYFLATTGFEGIH